MRRVTRSLVGALWAFGVGPWTPQALAQARAPDPSASALAASPRASNPARTVELNAASRGQLESVGGIGPTLAAAMLAARDERPFDDWDDVRARVRGVGPASALRLSARGLRVNGRACETAPAAGAGSLPAPAASPSSPAITTSR